MNYCAERTWSFDFSTSWIRGLDTGLCRPGYYPSSLASSAPRNKNLGKGALRRLQRPATASRSKTIPDRALDRGDRGLVAPVHRPCLIRLARTSLAAVSARMCSLKGGGGADAELFGNPQTPSSTRSPSSAIQHLFAETVWVASSQGLLAMTTLRQACSIR